MTCQYALRAFMSMTFKRYINKLLCPMVKVKINTFDPSTFKPWWAKKGLVRVC